MAGDSETPESTYQDPEQIRIEKRRLRMRLAQRKHRARQEEKVTDLEGELQALRLRVKDFETNFNQLEAKVLESVVRDPQTFAQVSAGFANLRYSCDLRLSPYQDCVALPPTPLPSIPAGQRTPESIPNFSLRLLTYAARLAYRVLCTRDSPSLRLARRIFQYRLTMDAHRGEINNLDYLQDCLGCWAKTLAGSHDRSVRFAKKVLAIPRFPGYSGYLDVNGVEEYLRTKKGVHFTDDAVLLDVKRNDSYEVSNDTFDQLAFESSFWPETQAFVQPEDSAEVLPFGLMNEPIPDEDCAPLTPSSMRLEEDWAVLDPSFSLDNSLNVFAHVPENERQVRVDMNDLVERLALTSICIGGPGPGFLPSDVDNVLERLSDTANRMLS